MKIDYHTHHKRCGHAVGTLREYIEKAIEMGLHQIGLSDHMPLFHMNPAEYLPEVAMPMSEFNEYRKAMYEFVAIELKGRFMAKFKLAHRKFVFDPSNNNIKVSNLTDLSLLKITGENLAEQLPTIVSIFCKEKKVWYMPFRKPLEFQERMNLFKDKLNLEIGFGVAVFFCKVSEELPNLMQSYLEAELLKVDNLLNEAKEMIRQVEEG